MFLAWTTSKVLVRSGSPPVSNRIQVEPADDDLLFDNTPEYKMDVITPKLSYQRMFDIEPSGLLLLAGNSAALSGLDQ